MPSFHSSSSSSISNSSNGNRNSHHRRRSSVSTRRESAEMMGVSLPDLPPSHNENNINLGDKDSIRRRALWALEGKAGPDQFSTVEIPELTTPELERRIYDFPTKPSYPPGIGGGFGSGLSGLSGKRDSFGKHLVAATSTSKDQLHTLVEEEEEEDEDIATPEVPPPTPAEFSTENTTPVSARHRPMGLNLRKLSLTPDNVVPVNGDLPTPAYTPSPKVPGLKSLTLTASPNVSASAGVTPSFVTPATRRPPLAISPGMPMMGPFRRSSLTYHSDSVSSISSDGFEAPKKRSSISYKPSHSSAHGLPTPEATPTSERRASLESDSDWSNSRPFLDSEHQFLYQSQAALVQRISDLEAALKSRSRPQSFQSDVSSQSTSEPSDEMLQLLADLKAERDELKKDVDGWRTRVADLEKQTGTLARRVDQERREAWVARERVGLLEVERRTAVKVAEEKEALAADWQHRYASLEAELESTRIAHAALQDDLCRGEAAQAEVIRLKAALDDEVRRRQDLERELESVGALSTPKPDSFFPQSAPFGHRWAVANMSVDSDVTDVGSAQGSPSKRGLELGAVIEEDEDDSLFSGEEDGLAGYEDEGDDDYADSIDASSSFGDFPRSDSHLSLDVPSSPTSSAASPSTSPTHERSESLIKAWSFPAKGTVSAAGQQRTEEVDRFFGCLEDLDDSPPLGYTLSDASNNPFSKGFFGQEATDDDELPPFVLPADVGVEVFDSANAGLDSVVEEDEEEYEEEESTDLPPHEEFIGEEDEGGIKFVFSIPPEYAAPSTPAAEASPLIQSPVARKPGHVFSPFDEGDESFSFSPRSSDFEPPQTPISSSLSKASPSSIPRASSLKRFSSTSPIPSPRFSPSQEPTSSFITPPSKRGGARPSFIPQPRKSSPSPSKIPTMAAPTFLPQPQRKSLPALPQARIPLSPSKAVGNADPAPYFRSSEQPAASDPMLLNLHNGLATPSRLSFQTFTNLIPLSAFPWSTRAAGKVAASALCAVSESASASSVSSVASEGRSAPPTFMPMLFGGGKPGTKPQEKRGFVPKERQLRRLRLRMQEERQGGGSAVGRCPRCGDDAMVL
ncbi:hypothetical protein OF83DRAFT_534701 [Amylostereum chailletii]|nr:hypothetical protein OF83DRAFT_534701 [Amylostereum chailletii]